MVRSSFHYSFPHSFRYYLIAALVLFDSWCLLPVTATHYKSHFCNTFDPQCGLTPERAFQNFLTPYDQLLSKLLTLKRRASFRLQVGPLIQNNDNGGIINIDKELSPTFSTVNISVCGNDINPSIREAVICTVTTDAVQPPRGNINASGIGYSTQGRPILAARFGNPRGIPIMVVTQQHGNEPASTEAAFGFLEALESNSRLRVPLLRGYDIVVVIRANPDGGEPSGTFNVPVAPFTESKGFFRHNVDPSAGGGFVADTESEFFGVVGRGYDMNRYHYVKLDGPIRPVETQALVAAQLAFRPRIVIDMHGDLQKSVCEVDRASIVPLSVFNFLPSGSCKARPDFVPSLANRRNEAVVGSFFATDQVVATSDENAIDILRRPLTFQQVILRKSISSIVSRLQPRIVGTLARFSHLFLGSAALNRASLGEAPSEIGAIGAGWEVTNFVSAFRPAALSVKIVDGKPVPELSGEPYIPDPCFLPDNICLHELFLRTTLSLIAGKSFMGLSSVREFCDIPLASGLIASAPSSLGWGNLSLDSDVLVPLGRFPAAPATIISTCPKDFGM